MSLVTTDCQVCAKPFTPHSRWESTCGDVCWWAMEQILEERSNRWSEPDDRYLEENDE